MSMGLNLFTKNLFDFGNPTNDQTKSAEKKQIHALFGALLYCIIQFFKRLSYGSAPIRAFSPFYAPLLSLSCPDEKS